MENTTYIIGKATVRIHTGTRTEEERQAAVETATQKFLKVALRQLGRSKKKEGAETDG